MHVTPVRLFLISTFKYNYNQGFKRLVLILQVSAIDTYYSCALIYVCSHTLKYILHLLFGEK